MTASDRHRAASVAKTFIDLLAMHRSSDARELTTAGGMAAQRSLLDLETWLANLNATALVVTAREASTSAYPVRTRVTLRARFGQPPGSVWVLVGRWTLASVRRDGSWRVLAELTQGRVAQGGLVNLRVPLSVSGSRGAVITGALDDRRYARAVVRVLDASAPRLARRYGHDRAVDHPVALLASNHAAARLICDCWFPENAVAVSTGSGVIIVSLDDWRGFATTMRNAIIVHELTHSAITGATASNYRMPWSLSEGAATYEEYHYAARHGLIEPLSYLADAYRLGYPTSLRWRSTKPAWGLTNLDQIRLAYADAMAVITVVISHGGTHSVLRLAQAFIDQHRAHGDFTAAQLDSAFLEATGMSFAQVETEAHLWVIQRG